MGDRNSEGFEIGLQAMQTVSKKGRAIATISTISLIALGMSACGSSSSQNLAQLLETGQCDVGNCDLSNLDLSNTDLSNATLSFASFNESTVDGANFSNATFENGVGISSSFSNVNFSGATMTGFGGSSVGFANADFTGSVLSDSEWSFSGFNGATFQDATLTNMVFSDVMFNNVNFQGATLNNVTFEDVELNEADLRGVDLSTVTISGSTVLEVAMIDDTTTLPSGVTLDPTIGQPEEAPEPEVAAAPIPLTDFIPVCEGQPVESAIAYTQDSGLHPTVWVEVLSGSLSVNNNSYIKAEWQAASSNEVRLVVCQYEQTEELLETCPYDVSYPDGTTDELTVYNYRQSMEISLVEASTATVLDRTTLVAETVCPISISVMEGTTERNIYGDLEDEVQTWLQSWVEIP